MAKAHFKLPDGTDVNVVGSADEILHGRRLQASAAPPEPATSARATAGAKKKAPKTSRPTLMDLIGSLIDGGFFKKKPQDLAAVKVALAEMGHHYPVTTLSGAMLQHVRRRSIRRLKQDRAMGLYRLNLA